MSWVVRTGRSYENAFGAPMAMPSTLLDESKNTPLDLDRVLDMVEKQKEIKDGIMARIVALKDEATRQYPGQCTVIQQ